MKKRLKISITIEDENGEKIAGSESEREIPYIEEIKEEGFRAAFDEYEGAVLGGRKEASEAVTSEYFKEISKKKPNLRQEMEKYLGKAYTE